MKETFQEKTSNVVYISMDYEKKTMCETAHLWPKNGAARKSEIVLNARARSQYWNSQLICINREMEQSNCFFFHSIHLPSKTNSNRQSIYNDRNNLIDNNNKKAPNTYHSKMKLNQNYSANIMTGNSAYNDCGNGNNRNS